MTAGFELLTDDGHLQLSTDRLYFRLEQALVLDNTGWSQHGTSGSYRDVVFTGPGSSDAPMLALASQAAVWHRQISSTSSSVTFRVYRTTSGSYPVSCWLFSRRLPPSDPPPFALYNSSGQCILSAAYPPARPLGVFKDGVYTGVSRTGRTLAFVPQTRKTYDYATYSAGGYGSCTSGSTPGYQFYQETGWSEDAVICWGASLSLSNIYMQLGPFPYFCSPTPATPPSNSRGTTGKTSALVLDVTDY